MCTKIIVLRSRRFTRWSFLFFVGSKNVGEKDEPLIIAQLASMQGRFIEELGFVIKTVNSYRGEKYPSGISSTQIRKAPTGAKRDVTINGTGYSLKSTRAAPPAIVNHTTREKWLRVCQITGVQIDLLDEIVSEYWELRIRGKIGEDISVSSPLCPFCKTRKRKDYLRRLINYFLFDGTGSKDSKYPATHILEFEDPLNVMTWRVLNRNQAFNFLWPKLVFSIRAKKGMPFDFKNMEDAEKKAAIAPWVRYIDGDYRGALHIRARR